MTFREDIAAASRTRINRGPSREPAALLAQARAFDAQATTDELTGARLAASELFNGSAEELCCIVDAELNRAEARGITLTQHLTGTAGTYGKQGEGGRVASTEQHPTVRHLVAARAVLAGGARGLSGGAVRFFDPKAQDSLFRSFQIGESKRVHSCSALGVLRAWSFDTRPCQNGRRCCADGEPPDDATPGRQPQEWVGPIAGVDAFRLMLFRPAELGVAHLKRFEEARALILSRRGLGHLLGDPRARLVMTIGVGAALGGR